MKVIYKGWSENVQIVAYSTGALEGFFQRGEGGVVLNVTFQKCSFCTDIFTSTLYGNCIKFGPPPTRPSLRP